MDETTGKKYAEADIVNYLYKTYGNGVDLPVLRHAITGWMPTLFRGKGMTKYEPEGFVNHKYHLGTLSCSITKTISLQDYAERRCVS